MPPTSATARTPVRVGDAGGQGGTVTALLVAGGGAPASVSPDAPGGADGRR